MLHNCKLFAFALPLFLVSIHDNAAATDGWTDLKQFLVPSDGSRSLGDFGWDFNETRDSGSRIVFFDTDKGDSLTAGVYWWNGSAIIDAEGSTVDEQGREYGADPLNPNEEAIKAFPRTVGMKSDTRLRTHKGCLACGYPDWYLFRRGQTHVEFDGNLAGGRSEQEPMVIAAYGPVSDGRAVIDSTNPLSFHASGDSIVWHHRVIAGLQLNNRAVSSNGFDQAVSYSGGVPTLLMEDCKIFSGQLTYLPRKTTVRRCISAYNYDPDSHNQGYFTGKFEPSATFDEVIFYKNGYKENPRTSPDPRRSIFDRNIYQGGGAQMGHIYRNIISADGGSGGPQMRLGGLCENSLIMEGYFYSSTKSTSPKNAWMTAGGQTGRSAIVRNNVQLVYPYPTPADPDTDGKSDGRAQPSWGYALSGASFGAVVENNIISGAMLNDELSDGKSFPRYGIKVAPNRDEYEDGTFYTQQNDTIRGNIAYRTKSGISLGGDWTDVKGHLAEGNVCVASNAIGDGAENLSNSSQLTVRNNRFYVHEELPEKGWIGEGNTVSPYEQAADSEGWSDPDRTLKRYVTENLNLDLLEWHDDPYLDAAAVAVRKDAGEAYDPVGLKTFMAVATNMRKGGTMQAPSSGKPSWTGDYDWDERFTGVAVVNWIREGFGMSPVSTQKKAFYAPKTASTLTLAISPDATGGYRLLLRSAPNAHVSVSVYDLCGRQIRDLGEYRVRKGRTSVSWDGANASGASIADRVCIVLCKTASGAAVASKLLRQH